MSETATAAPSSSKTIETVVEVGMPNVLNRSSSRMSVSMTARKMVISSGMVKKRGWNMPLRATSIMPLEKVTPARIPRLATIMMVRRGATREPTDELRKLTASLLTPTIRSMSAIRKRTPSENRYSCMPVHPARLLKTIPRLEWTIS